MKFVACIAIGIILMTVTHATQKPLIKQFFTQFQHIKTLQFTFIQTSKGQTPKTGTFSFIRPYKLRIDYKNTTIPTVLLNPNGVTVINRSLQSVYYLPSHFVPFYFLLGAHIHLPQSYKGNVTVQKNTYRFTFIGKKQSFIILTNKQFIPSSIIVHDNLKRTQIIKIKNLMINKPLKNKPSFYFVVPDSWKVLRNNPH